MSHPDESSPRPATPKDPADDEQRVLDGLSSAPPRSLRERVMSAAVPAPFAFVMKDQGVWLASSEAPFSVKLLLVDSRDRIATRLIRFDAPASVPPSMLEGRRTLFVMRGTMQSAVDGSLLAPEGIVDDDGSTILIADDSTLLLEYSQRSSDATPTLCTARARVAGLPAVPDGMVFPFIGSLASPRALFILAMRPNATLAEHEHHGVEELYVLAGSCEVEGRRMEAGDYHRAAHHSSHHPTITFDDGCELLVSVRDPDRLVATE
jgi:hypothetical protein